MNEYRREEYTAEQGNTTVQKTKRNITRAKETKDHTKQESS